MKKEDTRGKGVRKDPFPRRHQEDNEESRHIRQNQFDQLDAYLKVLVENSAKNRQEYFHPDYSSEGAYFGSVGPLRDALCRRMGFPPPGGIEDSQPRYEHVADDAHASIFRMWLEVLDGVEVYGIMVIPRSVETPAPLLITQHGGGGSPEIVAGFSPTTGNYNWMIQRALRHGFVAWAPSLAFRIGGREDISGPSRLELDRAAKNLGTSLLALEVWKIVKGLDAILERPEVDASKVAMMGLSYGGLYTQYVAALDMRVNVAVSSCFFNSRWLYPKEDWTFFNCFNEFVDAEVCALICPRPLMIEVGKKDYAFKVEGAGPEAERAALHWRKLGIPDRFVYREFEGGHEFNGEGAYEFVKRFI